MRPYIFIISLLFLFTQNVNGQDCDNAAAKSFVNLLFQKGQYLSYDSMQFRSYSEELTPVKTPLLNKLLPDYCFYTTTFMSNYYEFREVETALIFSKDKNKKSLFLHSPVFMTESKDFINFFYGLKSSDTSQRAQLAKEIMTIFSDITYKGHINKLINLTDKNVVSFELWHNDLSWRIYDFYFDNTNKLTDIKIIGGVKRQEMWRGYRRQ